MREQEERKEEGVWVDGGEMRGSEMPPGRKTVFRDREKRTDTCTNKYLVWGEKKREK